MKYALKLLGPVAAMAFAFCAAAAPAHAQGSNKFERTDPAKPPPARAVPAKPAPRAVTPTPPPSADANPLFIELRRKAAAGESENGFCAMTNWPEGSDAASYYFRESAVVGSTSMNRFNGGATCAGARVTEVSSPDGRKCVRYQWWACRVGQACNGGVTLSCKGADGTWRNSHS
jgi:hypothetical protein